MKGHVAKKGTRYYVVVDEDPNEMTGRRRQRWHSGFKTKRAAEDGLGAILASVSSGTYAAPSKVTLGAFLRDEWLPAHDLRPGTRALYNTMIGVYLLPHLGHVPLQGLSPSKINTAYAALAEGGGRGGRPLAPKTVRNAHGILHTALSDAVRWGRLARNPAAFANPPRRKGTEMQTWDRDQVGAFLEHVHCDRLYAAWILAATTGMRRGELLGLRWPDLDLDAGRLSVRRALVMAGREIIFSEPKTAKGRRSVPLPLETVSALRAHRAAQLEERFALGPGYADDGLMFAWEDGKPLRPDWFSRAFERHTAAAGLPPIRLHDVRHSFATLALGAGVHAKVVSEIMGHANVGITLDTYSHAIPAMQEEAATMVAGLIFGAR